MSSSDSDDDFPGERSNLHLEPGVLPPPSGTRDPSSVDLLKGIPPAPEKKPEVPVDILSTIQASITAKAESGSTIGGSGSDMSPAASAGAEPSISSLDEGSASSPPPASDELLDLNATSPWVDFWNLFYRPKAFFTYFARVDSVPGWVAIKAVVGLCFLSWLTALVLAPRHFEEISNSIVPFVEALQQGMLQKFPVFGEAFNAEDVQSRLGVVFLALSQVMVIAKPFVVLFMLLFTAATAYVFLPMVGAPKTRRSFMKIYVAGIFANWYTLVVVVPVVGPWIAFGLEVVFYTLAVKWIHGISFLRAFSALYLLGWLLAVVTVVVMAIAFVAVFALLGAT